MGAVYFNDDGVIYIPNSKLVLLETPIFTGSTHIYDNESDPVTFSAITSGTNYAWYKDDVLYSNDRNISLSGEQTTYDITCFIDGTQAGYGALFIWTVTIPIVVTIIRTATDGNWLYTPSVSGAYLWTWRYKNAQTGWLYETHRSGQPTSTLLSAPDTYGVRCIISSVYTNNSLINDAIYGENRNATYGPQDFGLV